jgi:hypothetical protein
MYEVRITYGGQSFYFYVSASDMTGAANQALAIVRSFAEVEVFQLIKLNAKLTTCS